MERVKWETCRSACILLNSRYGANQTSYVLARRFKSLVVFYGASSFSFRANEHTRSTPRCGLKALKQKHPRNPCMPTNPATPTKRGKQLAAAFSCCFEKPGNTLKRPLNCVGHLSLSYRILV